MEWATWTWSAMARQPLQQDPHGSPTILTALWPSSLDLAMLARRGGNVYTDPTLLDVAFPLAALP